jgi:CheY-like chemotaxis protein
MAEDDPDDRFLSAEALKEAHLTNELRFVVDGEDLMNYLCHRDEYSDPAKSPRPGLILLDLNMPRKDGREALAEIKTNDDLRRIPVVVLTTSRSDEDILRTYNLGVSGYVTKPVSLGDLSEVMKVIGRYWMDVVELPPY